MNDPLIVHVNNFEGAMRLVDIDEDMKAIYQSLTKKYWPGPLTLVVKANDELIPPTVTASTGCVGIRCPNHAIALELIEKSGVPIAAPSANKFGHISPTKPEHVLQEFSNDAVLIVDGGQCSFGIESTVAKLIKEPSGDYIIRILRRGGVSQESLQKTINDSEFKPGIKIRVEAIGQPAGVTSKGKPHQVTEAEEDKTAKEAPGMMLKHYSPKLNTYIIADKIEIERIEDMAVIDFAKFHQTIKGKAKWYKDLSERGDIKEAIGNIYEFLRQAEATEGVKEILLVNINSENVYVRITQHKEHLEALYDRMFRSAAGKIIS